VYACTHHGSRCLKNYSPIWVQSTWENSYIVAGKLKGESDALVSSS
jgi:hypothetical protein